MVPFKLFFEKALGLIEVINFKELGPVDAKVDSGNGAYNVLHGTDIKILPDGKSCQFKTINNKVLTKPVAETIDINIGAGKVEKRPVVMMDIEFNGKREMVPFSISDRSTNEEQVLLGKDFITKHGGLIDVTKQHNLGESYISRQTPERQREILLKIVDALKQQKEDGSPKWRTHTIGNKFRADFDEMRKIIDTFVPERRTWPKESAMRRPRPKM